MANQPVTLSLAGIQVVGQHRATAVATATNIAPEVDSSGNPISNGWYLQATGANVWISLDNNPPQVNRGFVIRVGDPPFLLIAPSYGFFFKAIQESSGAILQVQPIIQPN